MSTVLFISANFFKEKFPTTVGDATVEQAIQDAMYKHVHPVLGSSLYTDLKTKIAASGITGNDATLMANYIKDLTREWAQYELYALKGRPQINESGVYYNTPDKLEHATLQDVKYWREDAKWFALQLSEDLKKYLIDNASLFPAYRTGNEFINPSGPGDDWDIGIS